MCCKNPFETTLENLDVIKKSNIRNDAPYYLEASTGSIDKCGTGEMSDIPSPFFIFFGESYQVQNGEFYTRKFTVEVHSQKPKTGLESVHTGETQNQ